MITTCKTCCKRPIKYKSTSLCNPCYQKIQEHARIPKKCCACGGIKICRYRKSSMCATCYSKYDNPKYGELIRKRNRILAHTTKSKFSRGKTQARKRSIPWRLTFDEYKSVVEQPCFYCKESIDHSQGVCLDRISNDKSIGYAPGNVLPCCGRCNQIRGTHMTPEEAEAVITVLLALRKSKASENDAVEIIDLDELWNEITNYV